MACLNADRSLPLVQQGQWPESFRKRGVDGDDVDEDGSWLEKSSRTMSELSGLETEEGEYIVIAEK